MRCSQCGCLLSPSRPNCPRCGAAVGNVGARPSGKVRLTRDPAPSPSNPHLPDNNNVSHDAPLSWGAVAPVASPWESQPDAGNLSSQAGQFSPTPRPYAYQPHTNAPLSPTTGAQNNMYFPSTPAPASPTTPQVPRMAAPSWVQPQPTPRRQPRIKLGFTVAGMCLMAGALIMVFVFIMAQSLPLTPITASTDVTPQPTAQPAATQPAATQPTATQPQATPTATPTPPLSGNLYVDNTSLTNGVDARTGQPLQPTQTFRLGQSVYLTMVIHQAAYSGAICLNWSVNNHSYPYANPATPGGATYLAQTSAYFYYKPGSVGSGFVDIYWASSTACIDKVPIQHLLFTVTA